MAPLFRNISLGTKSFKNLHNFVRKAFSSNLAAGPYNELNKNCLVRSYSRDCPPTTQKPCPDKPACPPIQMPAFVSTPPKCNPTSIANLEGKIGLGVYNHPYYFWPCGRALHKWSFIVQYKEILILMVIMGGSTVFLAAMLFRVVYSKNDWMFFGHEFPYEHWDLRKPTIMKMYVINQPYRPMPFLQGILEDIRKCEGKSKSKKKKSSH